MRLTVARAYVKTITDPSHGVSAVGDPTSLRLHAQCQGLVSYRLGYYDGGQRKAEKHQIFGLITFLSGSKPRARRIVVLCAILREQKLVWSKE